MELNEIVKGNKLIAEFMGAKIVDPVGNCLRTVKYPKVTHGLNVHNEGNLEYDYSWDWLMPVIEKISKVPVIGATEQSDTCYPRTFGMLQDDTGLPMFRFNCCCLYVGGTLIEAAWIAVVEFIKMENNLKK